MARPRTFTGRGRASQVRVGLGWSDFPGDCERMASIRLIATALLVLAGSLPMPARAERITAAEAGYSEEGLRALEQVLAESGSESMLLMHDGKASPEPEKTVSSFRGNTTAALPSIIRHYKKRGHVFTDPAGRRL